MSFPQYPAYKDSGVSSPGKVPAHWDVVQLRHLARVEGGSTPNEEEILSANEEGHAWATPADMQGWHSELSFTSRRITDAGLASIGGLLAQPGDVLFSCRAPVGKVAVVGQAMAFNQGCKAIIPKPGVHGRFLAWQLDAARSAFDLAARGTTFPEVSSGAIRAVFLPRPPSVEQCAIADFLDRETAKLDTLVAEQEALLLLMEEKRAATISHVVTKGLDPAVPMKHTGVKWLGEVPAHWTVQRLKFLAAGVTVGVVVKPSQYYVNMGIPALRSLNVRPMRLDMSTLVYFDEISHQSLSKSELREGDVVAVRTGKPGVAAPVTREAAGYNCIDLILIRNAGRFDARFIAYVINSEVGRQQVALGSAGAIQQHFNIEEAANLLLAAPNVDEQRNIADSLDRTLSNLDSMAVEARTSIALLRERRAALISAAVTGRIDVRTGACRDLEVAA